MSIYLEFPAISEYPLYTYPFKEVPLPYDQEKIDEKEDAEEVAQLRDYLNLRLV